MSWILKELVYSIFNRGYVFRFTETCDTDKRYAPKWPTKGKKDTQEMLKKKDQLQAVFL